MAIKQLTPGDLVYVIHDGPWNGMIGSFVAYRDNEYIWLRLFDWSGKYLIGQPYIPIEGCWSKTPGDSLRMREMTEKELLDARTALGRKIPAEEFVDPLDTSDEELL